ncbi:nitrile hydratase [Caballeronia arvi]|uniref:Nitrile hydratase n=1 Tax=Caballeronia arvi TaxID=1777135 RepID=A0A158KJ82_9BURK|nr:SH3-like domain-containing protein [Caballeronia arvi]SAL81208.1 nitrile hydratase [Caballeronia arvi]
MLKPDQIPAAVAAGGVYRNDANVAPSFSVGDRVRVKNHQPSGHTRLPGYVRLKEGTIAIDHGVFVYPDTMAHGNGETPQHVYTVHFDATEVWGDKGVAGDTVRVDLFDAYLERCE